MCIIQKSSHTNPVDRLIQTSATKTRIRLTPPQLLNALDTGSQHCLNIREHQTCPLTVLVIAYQGKESNEAHETFNEKIMAEIFDPLRRQRKSAFHFSARHITGNHLGTRSGLHRFSKCRTSCRDDELFDLG
ncbi:predicted protein [Sclerotinia sclerotiorum 1980 UF-70]|uniref:Uncharacterized protein n=2 Tax=Sclerotinia sclerotiorum (strain ATCC 18683 / 1980 / Ss-1) TaxID=665079 RepID=A7EVV5_SCLS1|nr:predicted protein [Sclerotinia sclerotiorum 1980 UF-70]APA15718.1 hypothetical protein sscle_15g104880 [Sclerotinia sclerotiorum 1980 UF-70]EDN93597.1 predicted protein [Sclerotinia sclerotiorum 1980 UF-70]